MNNTVRSIFDEYDFSGISALSRVLGASKNDVHRQLSADLEEAICNIEDVYNELDAEGFFDPSY